MEGGASEQDLPTASAPMPNWLILVERLLRFLERIWLPSAWMFIAYQAADAFRALAGKNTLAEIGVALGVDTGLTSWEIILLSGWPVAIASAVIAHRQARLRKEVIAHHDQHVKRLEQALDPDRSSSGLQPTGETPPDDT
jgi:hypothetical protein